MNHELLIKLMQTYGLSGFTPSPPTPACGISRK